MMGLTFMSLCSLCGDQPPQEREVPLIEPIDLDLRRRPPFLFRRSAASATRKPLIVDETPKSLEPHTALADVLRDGRRGCRGAAESFRWKTLEPVSANQLLEQPNGNMRSPRATRCRSPRPEGGRCPGTPRCGDGPSFSQSK